MALLKPQNPGTPEVTYYFHKLRKMESTPKTIEEPFFSISRTGFLHANTLYFFQRGGAGTKPCLWHKIVTISLRSSCFATLFSIEALLPITPKPRIASGFCVKIK